MQLPPPSARPMLVRPDQSVAQVLPLDAVGDLEVLLARAIVAHA